MMTACLCVPPEEVDHRSKAIWSFVLFCSGGQVVQGYLTSALSNPIVVPSTVILLSSRHCRSGRCLMRELFTLGGI